MTNAFAIALLKQDIQNSKRNISYWHNEVGIEALELAIKALEQQPSDDCISRESLRQKLQEHHDFFVNTYGSFEDMTFKEKARVDEIDNCIAMVVNEPSVTPQSKIGYWIENAKTYYEELYKRGLGVDEYTPYFTDDIACSECLAKYSVIDNETQFFKHCPNCGAQMGGSK